MANRRNVSPCKVIAHFDADGYEAQVLIQEKLPELVGKDVPVVVTNQHFLVSMNYSAKALGVTRGMDQRSLVKLAEEHPNIVFLPVDKDGYKIIVQDLSRVEKAEDVLETVQDFQEELQYPTSIIVERSSGCLDEFFIDMTELIDNYDKSPKEFFQEAKQLTKKKKQHPNAKYFGTPYLTAELFWKEAVKAKLLTKLWFRKWKTNHELHRLFKGCIVADQIIQRIYVETGIIFSCGVSSSKLFAKITSSKNKPEGISLMTSNSFPRLRATTGIQELPGFKSETGKKLNDLWELKHEKNMMAEDVIQLDEKDLQFIFEKAGVGDIPDKMEDLVDKCNGIDTSTVVAVLYADRVSVSIPFAGLVVYELCTPLFDARIHSAAEKFLKKVRLLSCKQQKVPTRLYFTIEGRRKNSPETYVIERTEMPLEVTENSRDWNQLKDDDFHSAIFKKIKELGLLGKTKQLGILEEISSIKRVKLFASDFQEGVFRPFLDTCQN